MKERAKLQHPESQSSISWWVLVDLSSYGNMLVLSKQLKNS